jgi:DNA-binding MurR/RpiR family transcriptional regulator
VVLGLGSSPGTQALASALIARGLNVESVADAETARRLAVGRKDTAVVIPVAPQSQGGLLATAKIVTSLPTAKVILVTPLPDERVEAFAEFIDATLVVERDGWNTIVDAI